MSRSQPPASPHDPLEDLHAELRRSNPALGELRRTAEKLRDEPDRLRASLAVLLDDNVRLQVVAARSSDHPNSFAKIVLHSGGGYGIRLHVWRRGSLDVQPHGHRWEFASWVVSGTLRETTFAEEEVAGDARYVRTTYHRDDTGAAHHGPAGTVTLRFLGQIDRAAGTVYTRTRSVLHTAVPKGRGPVASLVLQRRPPSSGSTLVYSHPDARQVSESRLLADEVRRLVAEVMEAIP